MKSVLNNNLLPIDFLLGPLPPYDKCSDPNNYFYYSGGLYQSERLVVFQWVSINPNDWLVINPNAGFISPNAGFINPNARFINPDARFINPNDWLVINPNAGFIDPIDWFISPGRFINQDGFINLAELLAQLLM